MRIEVELKLELRPEESLRLRKSWGEPDSLHEQRNLYYEDAEDVSLWARQGFSIRLREQDGCWVLGVKGRGEGEAGWSRRPEWEKPVVGGEFAGLLLGGRAMRDCLKELIGEIPGILEDSELSLRGELVNTRRRYRLPKTAAVVELDHFRLPDGNEGHELELENDDPKLRSRAEEELRGILQAAQIEWRPSETSKRERFERSLHEEQS